MTDAPTQLHPLFLCILQGLAFSLRCLSLFKYDYVKSVEAVQYPARRAQYDVEALVWKWFLHGPSSAWIGTRSEKHARDMYGN